MANGLCASHTVGFGKSTKIRRASSANHDVFGPKLVSRLGHRRVLHTSRNLAAARWRTTDPRGKCPAGLTAGSQWRQTGSVIRCPRDSHRGCDLVLRGSHWPGSALDGDTCATQIHAGPWGRLLSLFRCATLAKSHLCHERAAFAVRNEGGTNGDIHKPFQSETGAVLCRRLLSSPATDCKPHSHGGSAGYRRWERLILASAACFTVLSRAHTRSLCREVRHTLTSVGSSRRRNWPVAAGVDAIGMRLRRLRFAALVAMI